MRLAQGSTRFNLSKIAVMKIKVKLPSIKEQQKIAEVLTTADKEIDLLKNELEELKEQKKGLISYEKDWEKLSQEEMFKELIAFVG